MNYRNNRGLDSVRQYWSVNLGPIKTENSSALSAQRAAERKLAKNIKPEPLILDAVADICSLYPRRSGTIWKHEGQKRWMQWRKPLSDAQIVGAMADDWHAIYRGCHWDENTRFAVIDIDQGSKYHRLESLNDLAALFGEIGLQITAYQSSDSGGWHLYIFLDNWESSAEVEQSIKGWLKSNGYEIKSGTLEVFPSGNALRLPLQRGFGWIGSDGTIAALRDEMTRTEAITAFLANLETNKRNWTEAKSLIDSRLTNPRASLSADAQEHRNAIAIDDEGFDDFFRIDHAKYQRGRQYWKEGLTGFGQRNDAVLCIGYYLWFGDKSEGQQALPFKAKAAQRADLIYKWLERHHNGFSRAVNSGEWSEIRSEIERACSWTSQVTQKRDYEPYPLTERLLKRLKWLYEITGRIWTVDDLKKGNEGRAKEATEKIAIAVAQLEAEGQLVSKAAVARKAGASRNTVSKYSYLLKGCSSDSIGGGSQGFSTAANLSSSSSIGCSEISSEISSSDEQVDQDHQDCPSLVIESLVAASCDSLTPFVSFFHSLVQRSSHLIPSGLFEGWKSRGSPNLLGC